MSRNLYRGFWNYEEQRNHINYLELKAVLLGLQSLCVDCSGRHILVQSDDLQYHI